MWGSEVKYNDLLHFNWKPCRPQKIGNGMIIPNIKLIMKRSTKAYSYKVGNEQWK